jgi:crotonobetainyl-CoA:carnitine CoA-transferase CaiB-like acyl-CoA transferase
VTLPLAGITVVAVEQAVAAPLATRQLADLGARVIKVERPDGGDFARSYDRTVNGLSSHFVWLNRNKESVTLDLKDAEGLEALRRLIGQADVLVQNLAPGAFERLGLGVDELLRQNPRLIMCSISGYGDSGPLQHRKAYDLLIQAEAGLLSVTGTEAEPAKSGISIADIAAGMYAYSGVLSALYEREHTGKGRHLSVALLDALAEWMGYPYYYGSFSGHRPVRAGAHHAAIAPYGPVECADGSILLAVQNEREWQRLCLEVLDEPELARDPRFSEVSRRVAHRTELDGIIAQRLGRQTVAEVQRRLDEAKIAYGRMTDVSRLAAHPQLVARDRVGTVLTEQGPVPAFSPVVTTEGWEPRRDPVPAAGEHTHQIEQWLAAAEVPAS